MKISLNNINKLFNGKGPRLLLLVGFVLTGMFLLVRSFAASDILTLEPETLRLEGNAFVGHDDHDGSSPLGDGHYVSFGTPAAPEVDSSLQQFASGLESPVDIVNNGIANDNRLFVVSKNGIIQIVQSNGAVSQQPFLDIRTRVSTPGERGLLGLAFHPNYQSNGFFFVYYTDTQGDITISRFSRLQTDRADQNSERVLLKVEHSSESNHNGGALRFGPDGYLYIGTGDGGNQNDPQNNAQNINNNLGAILRIDVNNGNPYSIPAGNPFAGSIAGSDEIYLYGMRNPWRISFDRVTGELFVADVGQDRLEEVNIRTANSTEGHNYGWKCYEGLINRNVSGCGPASNYVKPAYQYDHSLGCRSITGGLVYRGSQNSEFKGMYVFADYVCGDVTWLTKQTNGTWEVNSSKRFNGLGITAIGEDVQGEVYIAGIQTGRIYKIVGDH